MVVRVLGHADLKMLTKIYDHTSVETLREAMVSAREKDKEKQETVS